MDLPSTATSAELGTGVPPLIEEAPRKRKFRDVSAIIRHSDAGFDFAYEAGVMGLHGRPAIGRSFRLRNGESVVDFARGSYLGLDNHPKIVEGAVAALRDYGALQCNTSKIRLNLDIADELEARLSELFRARTILSSLVMSANMAVLPLIAAGAFTNSAPPIVAFDRLAHATLAYHKPVMAEDTEVFTIQHNNIDQIESLCKKGRVAYVLDGVYSMGGEAPLKELRYLQDKYGLFLYIDDAHGISIFGERGEGFARSYFEGDLDENTIIAASLGKAFGAGGAAIMLGTVKQEKLITRYGIPNAFSIGPNIATVGAALASVEIHNSAELEVRQTRLRLLLQQFDRLLLTKQAGSNVPIRMVTIGREQSAIECARWLLSEGIYVMAAFYPTVAKGSAGIRLCLTSDHTPEAIDDVVNKIGNWIARNVDPSVT